MPAPNAMPAAVMLPITPPPPGDTPVIRLPIMSGTVLIMQHKTKAMPKRVKLLVSSCV
jgi:hypothetical protein